MKCMGVLFVVVLLKCSEGLDTNIHTKISKIDTEVSLSFTLGLYAIPKERGWEEGRGEGRAGEEGHRHYRLAFLRLKHSLASWASSLSQSDFNDALAEVAMFALATLVGLLRLLFVVGANFSTEGQMDEFKHAQHLGRPGVQICWPNPTKSLFTSAQMSLEVDTMKEACHN